MATPDATPTTNEPQAGLINSSSCLDLKPQIENNQLIEQTPGHRRHTSLETLTKTRAGRSRSEGVTEIGTWRGEDGFDARDDRDRLPEGNSKATRDAEPFHFVDPSPAPPYDCGR